MSVALLQFHAERTEEYLRGKTLKDEVVKGMSHTLFHSNHFVKLYTEESIVSRHT